uniref:AEC family transporter n=1 Tax=Thaumasiovibrio occultus TaxID=1891184 RepID=UPI000B34FBC1|nr:AEC family transporter [Thaumasiovibrio occultus]
MLFLANLKQALLITSPIFIMLILGAFLQRQRVLTNEFIDVGSNLVFKLTLPAMLFLSIVNVDVRTAVSLDLLGFALSSNLIVWLLITLLCAKLAYPFAIRGVVVQGAFRANTAIIGVALMSNAYGPAGIAASAFYVATLTLLYNILAVISLTPKGSQTSFGTMIKAVGRNPLIIAILLATTISILQIPVPQAILVSGQYFADMTLPLALLCTGASLDFRAMRSDPAPALLATALRLIIVPIMIVSGAIMLGYRDTELGLIFFMSASPTAAASYVMAKAMKGDARLAANIIALTTLLFAVTASAGFAILRSWSLA